ncbi:MAG: nucleotide sugar dehydrogenase [Candidatus Paceibacterales bacterium]
MTFKQLKLAVVGLGYVGLPLAVAFGKTKIGPVLGFDISKKRIKELKRNFDRTGEVDKKDLIKSKVKYSFNPKDLSKRNFIITALPTPIDKFKRPDLRYIKSASKIIGENLKAGTIVVFESTVYPGVTEEICGPIIEKYSKLKTRKDFKLGYSPERLNPGDKKHTIDKIVKIISAQDRKTLDTIEKVYGLICKAGLYRAPSIKTAEAAKIIENIQRDLNIALVNELSLIFSKMNLDVREVMKAAATKWNIQYFEPGLVGGGCIPKDPYLLTYKARKLGHYPKIILAGRKVNEYIPYYVANLTFQALREAKKKIKDSKILVLGLTFKENCRDYRNSRIEKTIKKLKNKGCQVFGYDPLLSKKEIETFGLKSVLNLPGNRKKFDALILSVIHNQFKKLNLMSLKKISKNPLILIDIKGHFRNSKKDDFIYKSI